MLRNEIRITFTFSHLADAFIQSVLQMRTIVAIIQNKQTSKLINSLFFCKNKMY